MKISETTFTVNHSGSLKIPAAILREMGLGPGSHVRVAYLTEDGQKNTFQEFFLSADPIDTPAEETQLQVPDQLLAQANLPVDADLQILCLDGLIVICRDMTLSTDELSAIWESLKVADDLSYLLPSSAEGAARQLREIMMELQKEDHEHEDE